MLHYNPFASYYLSYEGNQEVMSIRDLAHLKEMNLRNAKVSAIYGDKSCLSGDYECAIKFYQDAIKLFPLDYRFYVNLSFCLDELCHYEEALANAETATNLNPTSSRCFFRKGRALKGLKRYEEARDVFKMASSLEDMKGGCAAVEEELKQIMKILNGKKEEEKELVEDEPSIEIGDISSETPIVSSKETVDEEKQQSNGDRNAIKSENNTGVFTLSSDEDIDSIFSSPESSCNPSRNVNVARNDSVNISHLTSPSSISSPAKSSQKMDTSLDTHASTKSKIHAIKPNIAHSQSILPLSPISPESESNYPSQHSLLRHHRIATDSRPDGITIFDEQEEQHKMRSKRDHSSVLNMSMNNNSKYTNGNNGNYISNNSGNGRRWESQVRRQSNSEDKAENRNERELHTYKHIYSRYYDDNEPTNPWGFKGLAVEPVIASRENEKKLKELFGRYGNIVHFRFEQNISQAIMYYEHRESPRLAMAKLQGVNIPDVCNQGKKLRITFRPADNQINPSLRLHDECYFWRTTGCNSNKECKLKHIPANKGVDIQYSKMLRISRYNYDHQTNGNTSAGTPSSASSGHRSEFRMKSRFKRKPNIANNN